MPNRDGQGGEGGGAPGTPGGGGGGGTPGGTPGGAPGGPFGPNGTPPPGYHHGGPNGTPGYGDFDQGGMYGADGVSPFETDDGGNPIGLGMPVDENGNPMSPEAFAEYQAAYAAQYAAQYAAETRPDDDAYERQRQRYAAEYARQHAGYGSAYPDDDPGVPPPVGASGTDFAFGEDPQHCGEGGDPLDGHPRAPPASSGARGDDGFPPGFPPFGAPAPPTGAGLGGRRGPPGADHPIFGDRSPPRARPTAPGRSDMAPADDDDDCAHDDASFAGYANPAGLQGGKGPSMGVHHHFNL